MEDVARVNLHFLDNPGRSGIFNLGSGRAQPFNDVALAVINSLRGQQDQPPLSLQQAIAQGLLEYIEFPDSLRGKYQCYTCADIAFLHEAGYRAPMLGVEEGVERYCRWLLEQAA